MNNLKLLPVEATDEKAFWEHFPNSPHRRVMHNKLVAEIEEDRTRLEKCLPAELSDLQARIRARRELIGFFDRKQTLKT